MCTAAPHCDLHKLQQVFDHCKEMVASNTATSSQMQTVLTTLGCIAEVLPDKAATQLRTVIASVVVKQVGHASCFCCCAACQ